MEEERVGISCIEDQKLELWELMKRRVRVPVLGCQNPKAPFQSSREIYRQDRVLANQCKPRTVRPSFLELLLPHPCPILTRDEE